jgi:hypothetical protein
MRKIWKWAVHLLFCSLFLLMLGILIWGFFDSLCIRWPGYKCVNDGGAFSEVAAVWGGALAAYLAFSSAIWIASSETRRIRTEKIQLGNLIANGKMHRVKSIKVLLDEILRDVLYFKSSTIKDEEWIDFFQTTNAIVGNAKFLEIHDIEKLIPLNQRLAFNLSAILENFDILKDLFSIASQLQPEDTKEPLEIYINGIESHIETTLKFVNDVHKKCWTEKTD